MQEHRKQLWGKITKVEGLIRGFGGDNAKVTAMPVLVTSAGQKDEQQHGLFRVERPDGQTRFVDSTGRIYEDMKDWRDNNQLPVGTMTYFKDGKINDAKDAKPNLVTEKTRTGFREGMEKLDGLGTATGIAGGALTLTVEGAVVGLPMMFGSMLYGGARTLGSMADRAKHGQSNTDMSDPEVRGNTIGLATALSVFPLGSAMKLGKAGLGLKALSPAMQKVAIASQYADTLAVLNSGVTLQQNWGNMDDAQKLASIGQIGFWGLSTGVSAKQAGGLKNLYGVQDIKNSLGKASTREQHSEISQRVRTRIDESNGKFRLSYDDKDLGKLVTKGEKLGLDNKTIEDLIFVGSREKKPISANELITQMDNYVNVVLKRRYPYRFENASSYQQFKEDLKSGAQAINLSKSDIRVQGSSLRTPNAKDIDVAVVVDAATYRSLITQRFNGRAKKNGQPVDMAGLSDKELVRLAKEIELDTLNRTKTYNSEARGLMYTILKGKINREDVPGLKSLESNLIKKYGDADVSVMKSNGELELDPYLKVE
jgi:hypothetical protein